MKLDLVFEETLAHPVEAVWEALTNREAISDWLMNAPASSLSSAPDSG